VFLNDNNNCERTTTSLANGSWTANLTVVGCDHNEKLPLIIVT
jgi:hypothetical protein